MQSGTIFPELSAAANDQWDRVALADLLDYMAIPCLSPAFDPDWIEAGELSRAAAMLARWARRALATVPGAVVEILAGEGRTPLILVDVPGEPGPTAVLYGHYDKQPPMEGWSEGRSAFTPLIEGDRIYGRGGADDGYAIFASIIAILSAKHIGMPVPRCLILIEGSEESGSGDLPFYVDQLAERLGDVGLIVALDAYCGDYERLWATTSVRGQVAGTLTIKTLEEPVHSGDASGAVPSTFRLLRMLLSRLEDEKTGVVLPEFLRSEVPAERAAEAEAAAAILGRAMFSKFPVAGALRPVTDDMAQLGLNCTWRPQLAVIGLDGLPRCDGASASAVPEISVQISMRLPPRLDARAAAHAMTALLERDPPYGASTRFSPTLVSQGWEAPAFAPWLADSLAEASAGLFGNDCAMIGGGGGIPFLSMLGERFPSAQFLVTGVLGPGSNAHAPNEFLHLPMVKSLTAALAIILGGLARNSADARHAIR
jgi:acetylornithine deacetylase/succinyl-diaminopimelate desuccinylase-like protein